MMNVSKLHALLVECIQFAHTARPGEKVPTIIRKAIEATRTRKSMPDDDGMARDLVVLLDVGAPAINGDRLRLLFEHLMRMCGHMKASPAGVLMAITSAQFSAYAANPNQHLPAEWKEPIEAVLRFVGHHGRLNVSSAGLAVDEGYTVNRGATTSSPPPLEMLLTCPIRRCGRRHVDKGEFATKPHHTHACQFCGHTWRPAVVATVGVQFLPGFKDPS